MPGDRYDYPFSANIGYTHFIQDPSLVGAGVVFRDAAGVRWQLGTDGQLDEISASGDGSDASECLLDAEAQSRGRNEGYSDHPIEMKANYR